MAKIQNSKAEAQKSQYRSRQAWKPRSVSDDSDKECPYCGGDIKNSYAICPHCGRSLTVGKCSFCGAAMKEKAKFCSKCGQSREGIICPECGTLNSRNFCRKCGIPLTDMAQLAMKAAKNDPAFKAIQAKADELAELHARIEAMTEGGAEGEANPPQLSEADRQLLDEYADILGSIGSYVPKPVEKSQSEVPTRKEYADDVMSLDEIMAAYKEKAAEMNEALAALAPPPEFTPEQQRDYYCARKIARVDVKYDMTGYRPNLWVCNFCGYPHFNPAECSEPELGGTWIYVTPEEYIQKNGAYLDSSSSLVID